MKLSVPRVENHQPDKHHHVGQPIQRRIKEPTKPGYSAGQARYLPIEHVEQVRDDQDDSGPEKVAPSKQQPRPDIYRYADESQKVRTDMPAGKPPHHRVDNALTRAPNAGSKHPYAFLGCVTELFQTDPLPKGTSNRMIETHSKSVKKTSH